MWSANFAWTIEGDIEICYIPGHAGIKYNERADWLAGNAKPSGSLDITQDDLIQEVSQKFREEELAEPTFSLTRLKRKKLILAQEHARIPEGVTKHSPHRSPWE